MSELKPKCAEQVKIPSTSQQSKHNNVKEFGNQEIQENTAQHGKEEKTVTREPKEEIIQTSEEVYDLDQDYTLSEKIMEEYFPSSMGDSPSLGLCTLFEVRCLYCFSGVPEVS